VVYTNEDALELFKRMWDEINAILEVYAEMDMKAGECLDLADIELSRIINDIEDALKKENQ